MSDWGQWLSITSNPQNTPFGAYLEAEAKLNIKLRNEAGQEIEIASWSDGFLSKRICESIEGKPTGKGKNCKITTPGKVISEALTFQLSTGPRTLIEADEINEIIGALINQLTLQAMQGINGLLGLGGNSNYSDNSFGTGSSTQSFVDAAAAEMMYLNGAGIRSQIDDALAIELEYQNVATSSLADARARLALVTAGQAAIAAFFAEPNSSADFLNVSRSGTLDQAYARIRYYETGDRDSFYSPAQIAIARTHLNAISDSITAIAQTSGTTMTAAQLSDLSFSQLEAEGRAIETRITNMIADMIAVVPQVLANITALNELITRYDTATASASSTAVATSSRSAAGIRHEVVLDFITLVEDGVLTTAATVIIKRDEWGRNLR